MFQFEIDRLKMQKALLSLLFASFFTASGTSRRVEMKFDDRVMLHISRVFIASFHTAEEWGGSSLTLASMVWLWPLRKSSNQEDLYHFLCQAYLGCCMSLLFIFLESLLLNLVASIARHSSFPYSSNFLLFIAFAVHGREERWFFVTTISLSALESVRDSV